MANLATRQKIIFGVMGIVLLYAAVDLLMPKKKSSAIDAKQKTEELNTFVTTLSAGIGKEAAKGIGSPLLFSRAEKEWPKDPFLGENSLKGWIKAKEPPRREPSPREPPQKAPSKEGAAAPQAEFHYAGYIEVGQKRMAVINGIEYREGETLDDRGFVLKSVSPASVVIVNQTTKATLTVSLQE